jgi:hypothetical protein
MKKVTAISNNKNLKKAVPKTNRIKDILIVNMNPNSSFKKIKTICIKKTFKIKKEFVI